jgi:replication factor C subunit 3/5
MSNNYSNNDSNNYSNKINDNDSITMVEIPSNKISRKLLPWSEKYRPSSIDNILYHDKITKSITSYMSNFKLPHLLFYGPPGTGKTSTIIAIAKHYYKESYDNMIMVLNASEERGIETVRNRIKQFVISKGLNENPLIPSFKIIILDEIDAMTEDAQAILRKVIEKYVNNVRFCFICNYLKKINPAIQSRCVIFRFNPISQKNLYEYVVSICENEKIYITKSAIDLVIRKSNGDMRKILNILQSLYMHNNMHNSIHNNITHVANSDYDYTDSDQSLSSDTKNEIYKKIQNKKSLVITENNVSKILSCPTRKNIINIIEYLQNNNIANGYQYIQKIINKNGISLFELINNVYEFCMDYLVNNNKEYIKYSENKVIEIIKKLCIINENLTYCNNDNIQLVSFISIFYM